MYRERETETKRERWTEREREWTQKETDGQKDTGREVRLN